MTGNTQQSQGDCYADADINPELTIDSNCRDWFPRFACLQGGEIMNRFNSFAFRALENIRQEVTPDEGTYTLGGDVQHTYRDGTVRTRSFASVAPGSTEYEAFLYTLGGCKDDLKVTEQSNAWSAAYRNVNVLNAAASKAIARQEYKAGVNAPEEKRSLLPSWAKA